MPAMRPTVLRIVLLMVLGAFFQGEMVSLAWGEELGNQPAENVGWRSADGESGKEMEGAGFVRGRHRHDGFFSRFLFGTGFSAIHCPTDSPDHDIEANSMSFNLAFGGAIYENWILYGEASSSIAIPEIPVKSRASRDLIALGMYALGVARYFVPSNWYVSGAVGAAKGAASKKNPNDASTSDVGGWGVGGDFAVGKEWWVSDNWGLGIALQTYLAATQGHAGDGPWTFLSIAAQFSATYN